MSPWPGSSRKHQPSCFTRYRRPAGPGKVVSVTETLSRIVGGKIMPTGAERDPTDPPLFLLQASPSWAPWLPDAVFQRVPIGGAAQVLTVQADGSVAWANSAAGSALLKIEPKKTPSAQKNSVTVHKIVIRAMTWSA